MANTPLGMFEGLWVFLLIWKTYCFLKVPSHITFQSMSFNQVLHSLLSETQPHRHWNSMKYQLLYNNVLSQPWKWNLSFCAIKGWVRAVPPTPCLLYFTAFPFWLYDSFRDEKTKERVSSLALNAPRALITICFVLKCLNVLIWLSR